MMRRWKNRQGGRLLVAGICLLVIGISVFRVWREVDPSRSRPWPMGPYRGPAEFSPSTRIRDWAVYAMPDRWYPP